MTGIKLLILSYTTSSLLFFASVENTSIMEWGKFGLLGLVLFGVFYWVLKPLIKHLIDSQIKAQEAKLETDKMIAEAMLKLSENMEKENELSNKMIDYLHEISNKLK